MRQNNIFKKALSKDELHYDMYGDVHMSRVRSDRDISGSQTAFADTELLFNFNLRKDTYWVPGMSGFRLRLDYTNISAGAAVTQFKHKDNRALPYNLFACMMSKVELRKNQKPIETINNFVPQVDTFMKRISTTSAYKNKYLGESAILDPNFQNRVKLLSIDGDVEEEIEKLDEDELNIGQPGTTTFAYALNGTITAAAGAPAADFRTSFKVGDIAQIADQAINVQALRGGVVTAVTALTLTIEEISNYTFPTLVVAAHLANKVYRIRTMARQSTAIELIWSPAFDLFQASVLFSCSYEIMLQPLPLAQIRKNALESFAEVNHGILANNYNVTFTSIHYMLATIKGPPINDLTYFMRKRYIQCKANNFPVGAINTTEQSARFDVPRGCRALGIAFQTANDTNSTINSPSLFKSSKTLTDPAKRDQEQFLSQIYVEINQQTYPSYKEFPSRVLDVNGDTDLLKYVWLNNQMQLGSTSLGEGSEGYKEWLNAGPYYYFNLMPDSSQQARELEVYFTFSRVWASESVRLLLFIIQDELYEEKIVKGRTAYIKVTKV